MNKQTQWFFLGLLAVLLLSSFIHALPAGPTVNYVSNTTAAISSGNRSQDLKGTITTVTMSNNQQDFKWKAYVGTISGSLALDDANAKSIYDWAMGTPSGEVYATRYAGSVNWANVSCITQGNLNNEEAALGMPSAIPDNINNTFRTTTHKSFLVGTKNITSDSCKATATYINDTAQSVSDSAFFQEILLQDDITNDMIYTTMIETSRPGFDLTNYNFQMLVAENESNTVPLTYFFYVELG